MSGTTAQTEEIALSGTALTEKEAVSTPGIAEQKGKKRKWKKEKDNRRFTKKKLPLGKIIFFLILAGAAVFIYLKATNKGPTGIPVATVPLEKGDLVSAVNLTGTIESANDAEVYSKNAGLIQSVGVEVGDRVEAGQVMAQLDTQDYQLQIAEREASIEQTKRLNEFSIRASEKEFNAERVDVAAGLNEKLIAAENAVDRAQRELNAARRDYNDYRDGHDLADTMFKKAQKDLERASDAYWKANAALESTSTSDPNRAQVEEDYEKAEEKFEEAKDKYNQIDREYGSQMSSEARTYRDARNNYEQALKERDAAKNAIARSLDDLKDNVEKAELNMDFTADYIAIEQMKKKIADSTVTAPISGTVTAVYAKEGAMASGLLFIIEDTDDLVVKTAIKELDVGKVKPEMKAEVKADATGEKVFSAVVKTISPTAAKDDNGKTVTSGNVEFDTDVALTDPDPLLKVGMNVRVNVVTEEKKAVWSAPFDAVVSDASGQALIYTIETGEDGISRAKAVPVTTGMETDFYVEISGEGLKDGMPIISDPSMVQEGMEVLDQNAAIAAATAGAESEIVAEG